MLFTCAGRRNYLINYFKEALNGQGKVFAADMQISAPAMADADIAFVVPNIFDKNYISVLEKIVKENDIKAIISLNDLELPILSAHKQVLEQYGAKVIVAEEEIIETCFDKLKTVGFLQQNQINTPKTYTDLVKAKEAVAIGELHFPLVLKPRWGSASIGIYFPETLDELEITYQLQKIQLQRTILAEASKKDINNAILIQEKLEGQEYGVDILNDFKGNYVGTFVRKKLAMRAGETDKAITLIDNRFEQLGRIISKNLKHIGNLDCDVFEYNNELYVLELNPRFGGGYPFSHQAGINIPAIYIEWLKGNKDIDKYTTYRPNVMSSKCDRLITIPTY